MPDTPASIAADLRSLAATVSALADRVAALPTAPPPPPAWTPRFAGDVQTGNIRWGAAITGNGDPARHENTTTKPIGLRRTFWQWGQVNKMVAAAKADLAAGRVPWVSVKPPDGKPSSWKAVGDGVHDAAIDAMLRRLAELGGPVWLTPHHEPENEGGDPAQWRRMVGRFVQRRNALGVGDRVAIASILMAWTFDPRSGRRPDDWYEPTVDLCGLDFYVPDEKVTQLHLVDQFVRATAFYRDRLKPVALGEWANRGTNTQAATEMRAWYDHLRTTGVIGACYFDSDLNGGWPLEGEPLAEFRRLVDTRTSVTAREA